MTSHDGPREFPVTRWTVVLAAGGTPSPESAAALERLCGSYWYPLYAFVRRSGYSPPDAEDLTQEFFARLLEMQKPSRPALQVCPSRPRPTRLPPQFPPSLTHQVHNPSPQRSLEGFTIHLGPNQSGERVLEARKPHGLERCR
jgi:hypothetical protein